jgi:hypothetical protein
MSKHHWGPFCDYYKCRRCGSYKESIYLKESFKSDRTSFYYWNYKGIRVDKEPDCDEEIIRQVLE